MPTLKEHIKLILVLLNQHPDKEFYKLYLFCRDLLSDTELHSVINNDLDYFRSDFFSKPILGNRHYYYDKVIKTNIGLKTMRWFVETQLIQMIELHLKLETGNINSIVTLESVENLL